MSTPFQAGLRVRLKSNPARQGVLSGKTAGRSGSTRWEVVFPDQNAFLPGLALEAVPEDGPNPFEDMRLLRFGRPRELRSALTHARLGGKLADLIYSLYTTNTDFYAYQFKPVLSFLDAPSRGILIADEVGLGKTIEAGLIWTELRSRENARRLLVLCPAMLREKWRDELAERFGVDARICNTEEVVGTLERAIQAPGGTGFAMVTSMQGLRTLAVADGGDDGSSLPARFQRVADDAASEGSPLDLVIVDEAHYLRNPETLTARTAQLLRRMSENLVLLSATPVHLRNDDLFHLLHLLDRDSFPHATSFDEALRENAPLVELKDLLMHPQSDPDDILQRLGDMAGSPLAARSEALRHLLDDLPVADALRKPAMRLELAAQLDRMNPIAKVVCRTRKRDVHGRRVLRSPHALAVHMTPVEQAFYAEVTAAVRSFCSRTGRGDGLLLTIPQRQMCSSMAAACRAWSRRTADLDEMVDQILWDAFGDAADIDHERTAAGRGGALVAELSRIAHAVGDHGALRRHDSKYERLSATLREYWQREPDAKVVLFAYFRETLSYLSERLAEGGIDSVVLVGGMDKHAALRRFRDPQGPRILLASEVASEGIDLQFSAVLVNYDLPWNPMRIEQRIGRIDRIGQKAERIVILNLFLAESLDERVYQRLFARLRIFEQALGATEGVLGDRVLDMSARLLFHELSPEEEIAVIDQTSVAVEQQTRIETELEQEAGRLVAHGDYLQHRITASRDLNRYVTSEDLEAYVSDFVDTRAEGAQLIRREGSTPPRWELDLGPGVRARFAEFLAHERLQGHSRLAAPASGRQVVAFENLLQRPRGDVEVISQYHPLTTFIRRDLDRGDVHRHASIAALRLTAGLRPEARPGHYVFAVHRWRMHGEQESERLAFQARHLGERGSLDPESAERLVMTAVLRGQPWPDAPSVLDGAAVGDAFDQISDELEYRCQVHAEAAGRDNRDRIRFQLAQLDRQVNRDIASIRDVLERQRARGQTGIVAANEGRIRKIQERAAERRVRLESRAELRHDNALVCAGVIALWNGEGLRHG